MGCKRLEPRVSAPVTQTPTFLAVLLFPGTSSRAVRRLRGLFVDKKGDDEKEIWVCGVNTHFGDFIDSLQWRRQQRRTSHGAPSSGGRGSSPVCTRALKAKGTAGHDGNCPVWGSSVSSTTKAVGWPLRGGLCTAREMASF